MEMLGQKKRISELSRSRSYRIPWRRAHRGLLNMPAASPLQQKTFATELEKAVRADKRKLCRNKRKKAAVKNSPDYHQKIKRDMRRPSWRRVESRVCGLRHRHDGAFYCYGFSQPPSLRKKGDREYFRERGFRKPRPAAVVITQSHSFRRTRDHGRTKGILPQIPIQGLMQD